MSTNSYKGNKVLCALTGDVCTHPEPPGELKWMCGVPDEPPSENNTKLSEIHTNIEIARPPGGCTQSASDCMPRKTFNEYAKSTNPETNKEMLGKGLCCDIDKNNSIFHPGSRSTGRHIFSSSTKFNNTPPANMHIKKENITHSVSSSLNHYMSCKPFDNGSSPLFPNCNDCVLGLPSKCQNSKYGMSSPRYQQMPFSACAYITPPIRELQLNNVPTLLSLAQLNQSFLTLTIMFLYAWYPSIMTTIIRNLALQTRSQIENICKLYLPQELSHTSRLDQNMIHKHGADLRIIQDRRFDPCNPRSGLAKTHIEEIDVSTSHRKQSKKARKSKKQRKRLRQIMTQIEESDANTTGSATTEIQGSGAVKGQSKRSITTTTEIQRSDAGTSQSKQANPASTQSQGAESITSQSKLSSQVLQQVASTRHGKQSSLALTQIQESSMTNTSHSKQSNPTTTHIQGSVVWSTSKKKWSIQAMTQNQKSGCNTSQDKHSGPDLTQIQRVGVLKCQSKYSSQAETQIQGSICSVTCHKKVSGHTTQQKRLPVSSRQVKWSNPATTQIQGSGLCKGQSKQSHLVKIPIQRSGSTTNDKNVPCLSTTQIEESGATTSHRKVSSPSSTHFQGSGATIRQKKGFNPCRTQIEGVSTSQGNVCSPATTGIEGSSANLCKHSTSHNIQSSGPYPKATLNHRIINTCNQQSNKKLEDNTSEYCTKQDQGHKTTLSRESSLCRAHAMSSLNYCEYSHQKSIDSQRAVPLFIPNNTSLYAKRRHKQSDLNISYVVQSRLLLAAEPHVSKMTNLSSKRTPVMCVGTQVNYCYSKNRTRKKKSKTKSKKQNQNKNEKKVTQQYVKTSQPCFDNTRSVVVTVKALNSGAGGDPNHIDKVNTECKIFLKNSPVNGANIQQHNPAPDLADNVAHTDGAPNNRYHGNTKKMSRVNVPNSGTVALHLQTLSLCNTRHTPVFVAAESHNNLNQLGLQAPLDEKCSDVVDLFSTPSRFTPDAYCDESRLPLDIDISDSTNTATSQIFTDSVSGYEYTTRERGYYARNPKAIRQWIVNVNRACLCEITEVVSDMKPDLSLTVLDEPLAYYSPHNCSR